MTKYTYSEEPLEIYPPLVETLSVYDPEQKARIEKQIADRSLQMMEDMEKPIRGEPVT